MVEIDHILPEPASLAAHRHVNPNGPWDTLPPDPQKRELRHQLHVEQDGLCVYCESPLSQDDGHVEHIKSKTLNPSLTFVYDNLGHSCDGPTHCGHRKRRQILPIEPRPGANRHFSLSEITGKLSPVIGLPTADAKRATSTLTILGLNDHPGLNRRRQQFAVTVRSLTTAADVNSFLGSSPYRWVLRCL
jgi:uncharacterized protein (TIGR02646 family)